MKLSISPGQAVMGSGNDERQKRLLILDRVPLFRTSLAAALTELGSKAVSASPTCHLDLERIDLVVLGVDDEEDLGKLCGLVSATAVFAIASQDTLIAKARPLEAGAVGVAVRTQSLVRITEAIVAACRGYVLLEHDVVQTLCSRARPASEISLEACEREWLAALADGTTIAALAASAGYSEREMYRVMRRLYDRMGVENLYQALVHAARSGLLK